MIIQCVNCNKKFEVDSALIPKNGRTIQCGSCNHSWLFKNNDDQGPPETSIINNVNHSLNNNDVEKKTSVIDVKEVKNSSKNPKKKSFLSFGKILSYIIVIIISFIALVVILDTFKSLLINIFPNLELLLYNLFETIKDVILFIKNLIN